MYTVEAKIIGGGIIQSNNHSFKNEFSSHFYSLLNFQSVILVNSGRCKVRRRFGVMYLLRLIIGRWNEIQPGLISS